MQYLNTLVLFFLIIIFSALFLVLGTTTLAILAIAGGILFLIKKFKVSNKYSSYKKDNVIDVEYEVIEEAPIKKKPKKKTKP